MSGLSFELAAVAAAAMPELDVVAAAEHPGGRPADFDEAIVRDRDGALLLVRRARTTASERELLAERRALETLTAGVRSRLPFAVPEVCGVLREQGQTAVVVTLLPGAAVDPLALDEASALASSIGAAIAAVHALPRGFADEAGLSLVTPELARDAAGSLLDRADRTGRLPVAVHRRWSDAVDDPTLWQFHPRVIHGGLTAAAVLADADEVTGLLSWSDLRSGDPARDLQMLQALAPAAARQVLDSYAAHVGGADRQLRRRAALYAELEIARWLVHGATVDDEQILADAEEMLTSLTDRVHLAEAEPLVHETLPILDLEEVRALLRDAESSEPRDVQPGMVHGPGAAHPDDAQTDTDDDLHDDTPPSDFLRDAPRDATGEILGVDPRP